ncbi:MAG TPA: TIGR02147 family protein [Deltaproteobacteria bacterium]|nr:TIGR02147 family protein [Deltaproteobacteria bacterium]
MSAPNIYDYLDFRSFLRSWFEARKAEEPRFSKRSFARLAGKSSPGLLTEVLNGRQLSPKMVSAFANAMKLTAPEADFFDALVQLDQARSTRERNHAWDRISASRSFQEARRIEGASVRYLSDWWIPVIRELAHRRDFQPDPAWIAARIRPPITEAMARRGLETLIELEMLIERDDGGLAPAEGVLTTPQEVAGLAVHNYHLGMLQRAIESIDGVDPEERHLLAATVSVPHSVVGQLKDELNAFHRRIIDLCGRYEGDAEEVLQLHFVLFPLSDRAAGESS